jgi:hypothetical protein
MWKKIEVADNWKKEAEGGDDWRDEPGTVDETKKVDETKREDAVGAQRLPGSMKTYSEAVDEFSKHTSEFLACMPLLTKARDAYQRAMAVSAEVRSMLDAGDGTLRTLMAQLEDAVTIQLGKTPSDRKKPESVKAEPSSTVLGETSVRPLPK